MDIKLLYYYYNENDRPLKTTSQISIEEHISHLTKFSLFSSLSKAFHREFDSVDYPNDNKYIDVLFPPSKKSIFGDKPNSHCNIKWIRAEELAKETSLYSKIDPLDIKQGHLANCWFVAALSCLSERPDLIKKIFPSNVLSKDSRYTLNLFKDGVPVSVEIDSLIPVTEVDSSSGSHITSFGTKSKTGQIWVPLLEKAYSKLHGSYLSLASGECHEAFLDLTGYPSDILNSKVKEDPNDFFSLLEEVAKDRDYLLTAAINSKEPSHGAHQMKSLGLLTDHAYSVIDAKRLQDSAQGDVRLVQLRNPWSKFEWRGDFSDHSSKWTPELKKAVHLCEDEHDGLFWLDFEHFRTIFDTFSFCNCKSWATTSVPFDFAYKQGEVKSPTFRVTVPEGRLLSFISVHQKDRRIEHAPEYIDISAVVVGDKTHHKSTLPHCKALVESNIERFTQAEVSLGPGVYRIIPYSSGAHFKHLGVSENRKAALVLSSRTVCDDSSSTRGEAKELTVERLDFNPEDLVKAKLSALKRFGKSARNQHNVFTLNTLKNGGLIFLGLKNVSKNQKTVEYSVSIGESVNIVPALDSWQRDLEQKFLFRPEDNAKTALIGTFVRGNNSKCHFSAEVKFAFVNE